MNPWNSYIPRGGSARAIASIANEVLISGPAGTGKSRGCLEKLAWIANNYPHSRSLIVRKVRASLMESGLQTWEDWVLGPDNPICVGVKRQSRQSYRFPNGSEVIVGGMDLATKVMSTEYDMIYVQEACELRIDDWEALKTRLRNQRVPIQQLIADTNPAAPTHWLKRRCDGGTCQYIESYHQDNPRYWDADKGEWTARGKQYMSSLSELTGERLQRLFLGMWVQPEGAIYDIFNARVGDGFVVSPFAIPRHWPRVVGIDPVGQYTAAVWLAFDPATTMLHLYDEYMQPFGETTAGHVRNILKRNGDIPVVLWAGGGPTEDQHRLDWGSLGIPLHESNITDVWLGIERVYQVLKAQRLVIHSHCARIIDELGSYQRKQVNGIPTNVIQNKEDYHLLDALRYIVCALTDTKTKHRMIDVRAGRRIGDY